MLKAEFEYEKDKFEDLFYFRIQELLPFNNNDNSNTSQQAAIQSRPVLLTVREKALYQLGAQSQSDESHLVSRQCFCMYISEPNRGGITTLPFILAQKLMVNQLGQLLITIDLSQHSLLHLHNDTKRDLFIWPRISTNYILETYVKNLAQLNEKKLAHQRKFRPLIEKTKRLIDLSRSLVYMQFVPANSVFKFNYDFVGTNQFPLENINEQAFFMFALQSPAPHTLILSQNLCKIFETQFEIKFENIETEKLFYVTGNRTS